MANKPELTIKVNVDPYIDPQKMRGTIERKVNTLNTTNPPEVKLKPNMADFQSAIKNNLGGPYNVDLNPNLTENIGDKVVAEIGKIDKEKLKIDIKPDLEGFSTQLSETLRDELKEVNQKLSYYLKNLTTNSASLNAVVEGLFPKKGISNAVQHELKNIQKELQTGIGDVNKTISFKTSDLFKIDNKETGHTVQEVKKLINELKQDLWDLDESSVNGFDDEFVKKFDGFKGKAVELKTLISTLEKNLSSSDFKKIFNNGVFDTDVFAMNIESFIKVLNKISSIKDIPTLDNWNNILDKITTGAKEDTDYIDSFCEEAIEDLNAVNNRAIEIISEQKTAVETVKELSQTLNKAMDGDGSGYLSDAEIKTYGAAFDEVLSNIATKQAEINNVKQRTIALEDKLLIKTRINRDVLAKELEEYKKLLKSFGIKGDDDENKPKGKSKQKGREPDKVPTQKPTEELKFENQDALNNGIAKIQAIVFDINQEELQKSIDTIFAKVSAPIGFRPADGAIAAIKKTLEESFGNVEILNAIIPKQTENKDSDNPEQTIPVKGHVVITDTDITSNIINPVDIPVKAILKKKDITIPKTPIEIKVKAEITDTAVKAAAEKPKKKSKKKTTPPADEAEQLSFDSPELVVQKEEQKPIELPLPETPNYTKPSETLDDYRDSVGAAANIQQYFASEVDNATASLGSQFETLKALKKSLDEYTGSIDGIEKFAKAEKELDRLKKKLAQQPSAQPAPQQPNNQPPAPIKPNNNPKPNNNGQPPAPPTPPNNQPPNNGGNNGGGNNPPVESQQKLEQALERIMTKMITAQNKKDTSGDKGYGKNVAEQVKWQGQLQDQAEELIDKLNANYPGWEKGKSWQRHGERIAHARNDYSTAREDKQDLDTVQKLGNELQRNLKLREDLHKIDKNVENVKYQNTQDDIKKSKSEIARLRSEAKAKGLNTNEVTSKFLKSAAELQERLTNKAAAKAKTDADNWLDTAKKNINEAKNAYISAQKKIDELDKQAAETHNKQTQADIASEKKLWETKRDNAEKTINGYLGGNADKYATDANKEIDSALNRADIKDSITAEKENAKLLTDYNSQLQITLDILREIQTIDQNQSPVNYADAQRRLAESKAKTARLGNDIKGKGLTASADFIKANTEYVSGYKNLQEDIKNKEANAALKDQTKTLKENTDLLVKYDQELTKQFNLYKDLKRVDPNNAPDQAAKQLAFNNQKAKVDDLQKLIIQKGLHADPAYIQRNNQYIMDVAGFDRGQDIKADKVIDTDASKAINAAKKKYLDAYDAVQKKREKLSKVDDAATKQMIQNAIAVQRSIMKSAGNEINSYGKNYGNLVSDTWNEISIYRNDAQIKNQQAYETKSNKEAAATKKENLNLLKQYNQSLNEELKLLKQVYAAETAEGKAAAQNALNDQKDKTENLRKQLKVKGLDATPDYQKYNTQNALNEAAINAKYNKPDIDGLTKKYIANMREQNDTINKIGTVTDPDLANRMSQSIEENNKAIQEAGMELAKLGQSASEAWKQINKVRLELDYNNDQAFNKALDAQNKELEKNISDDEKLLNRIDRAMRNREKAYDSYLNADVNSPADIVAKKGRFDARSANLFELQQEAAVRGLTSSQDYTGLLDQHQKELDAINEAQQKRAEAEQEAIRVQDEDRVSLLNYIKTVEKYKDRLEQDNHTDDAVYGDSVKMANAGWDLLSELNKNPNDKNQVAYLWGQKYGIQGVTDLESAFKALAVEAGKAGIKVQDLRTETEKLRAETQARTNVANLKSQLMDYLEKFPKVEKGLAEPVQKLKAALADPNAYKNAGQLKQAMAELRAQAKSLGLESENLIDKFEKLFGTHLSTMITMAALHKMQDALRIVYQNVVEIDTALIELRKVSELSGKSLEKYMGRAAEQAQNLGVSISDYISSTADWKRLGYSDEDAESMATYSTLLKNVGDGIDDVNTSSSYLISTLQGFGLLAKDAESVVDQIDKVANTQPITAQAIGEILTRSAASMKAANNDLAETISLGTAAYAVIQNAETVGTTLKSVSMYLRAAKSELEDAGESADGCANSVSELRSELKSLTGVDIMIDNKNFKSTYQILKELSQVWDKLSDVTQANVTEMIGGKRNANAVSAILNNFDVAESSLEAAANSAGTAWEENSVWMDSIQARLAQLDASFQALSTDILSSDLIKGGVSFLTAIVKLLDQIVNLTDALPLGLGITSFIGQLGEPKMTGSMIVPSNTPGGDTEQVRCRFYWRSAAREYLVKPTNMAA